MIPCLCFDFFVLAKKQMIRKEQSPIITKIQSVYQSTMIYRAVMIVDEMHIEGLFEELQDQDYPVSTMRSVGDFERFATRVLLVTCNQLDWAKSIIAKDNSVDTLFVIGCDDPFDWNLDSFATVHRIAF